MKKYITLLLLVISGLFAHAQDKNTISKDSIQSKSDSLKKQKYKKPFKFTVEGIRFGFDILNPIYDNFVTPPNKDALGKDSLFNAYSSKQRFEGTIDVGFAQNRFFAVLDYGISIIDRRRKGQLFTGFSYQNVGSFLRIGADYNFMHRKFKDEVMFVGFRYARASFRHDFEFLGANQAWGYPTLRIVQIGDESVIVDDRYRGRINETNLSATWVEIVTGLRVNVWKQFFMGYTARLMIRSGIKGENILLANELPGFGSTNATARLIFNYYLYYRIPFLGKKSGDKNIGKVLKDR
jgi:Domain of unknown function (DUF6048)